MTGAGLNYQEVRMPIPFLVIDVLDGEPFLAKTCPILAMVQKGQSSLQDKSSHNPRLTEWSVVGFNSPVILAHLRMLHYIRIFTGFFSQPGGRAFSLCLVQ